MKLYAQHGFQPGNRIPQALAVGQIDGVIYSAKDIPPSGLGAALENQSNGSDRFFDPQYYASLLAAQPGARLGWLYGDQSYPYFRPRRRTDLEQNTLVRTDLDDCLAFQADLPLSGWIAPNIVIRKSLDSIEAGIAKEFIRQTGEAAQNLGRPVPVFATLAISAPALGDRVELQNFLQDITELKTPPDGFYLLVERADATITSSLTGSDMLSRWMLINHVLRINGFQVINGYSDLLSPYLAAAGGTAFASGWWNTLKLFSLGKFAPASNRFMRKPVARYTSAALLKSIRCTELHDLRGPIPEIMNDLPTDNYYDEDEGSEPSESEQESLQNWEALRAMIEPCAESSVEDALQACNVSIENAADLYGRISGMGYPLRDRSGKDHLDAIREELEAFRNLAEIS